MPLNTKIYLLFALSLLSCDSKTPLETVFKLPKKIKEASAVQVTNQSNLIWTLEDSGNKPQLYALNKKGKIKNTLSVTNAKNIDWEDLTSDKEGNLYIGDFGNNQNVRQDLCIYKISKDSLSNTHTESSEKITFYFPEQKSFPPKKSELWYDVEAFFISNNQFYLFTKNRSKGFDGTTFLYRVPNQEGNHKAELLGSYKTCAIFKYCAITSADISPDGKKVALLSNNKVWISEQFPEDRFLEGKMKEIDLYHASQKEGICFINDSTLIITDEVKKDSGGYLYELHL